MPETHFSSLWLVWFPLCFPELGGDPGGYCWWKGDGGGETLVTWPLLAVTKPGGGGGGGDGGAGGGYAAANGDGRVGRTGGGGCDGV